ncbi:pentatricopeptide repeat-containing protein At4g18520, chloroplastic-like [Selaginella moellendorffii]|uniref:pentatricopeptide repeat-containing protein At4g18520, chloroplastic-like n=1 Tax=Selaginella moellendorffii TaxID=88036 RepID=UPI000D1CF5C8|nr:pentatricopeptide repeat-containing protein At4g18520, chloroplastic-like [Selaginella moellendorffii]|eukprot:XP_024541807.1 pentatricopeptide repeat-containing protein At4g18520, chloroplastic-like [Selaginella moellendorffii]
MALRDSLFEKFVFVHGDDDDDNPPDLAPAASEVSAWFLCVAADRSLEQTLDLVVVSSSSSCSSWTSALSSSYAELLRRCGRARALEDGRRVHAHIVSTGQSPNPFLGNLLVQMYGKCGSLGEARRAFEGIPESKRNVYSWGLMISAYAQSGHHKQAIDLFQRMQETKTMVVKADCVILASVLGSCAASGDLQTGKAIDEKISSGCLDSNLVVETALLDMYAKCGKVAEARGTFDRMKERDVISWNAMLAAYAQTGHNTQAINLYHGMSCEGVFPDEFTFSTIVTSCSSLRLLNLVHAVIVESGMQHDDGIYCGLIKSYAKFNQIEESERIFRDVILQKPKRSSALAWTTMIAAYVQLGHLYAAQALDLYQQMIAESIQPNNLTFTTVLSACSLIGPPALDLGSKIHERFLSSQPSNTMEQPCSQWVLTNTLITMYAKCGSLSRAKEAFESIPDEKRGLVSWNAMLSAYAQLGSDRQAADFFSAMGVRGLEPDEVTFTSILGACARLGDLELGKRVHAQLKSTGPALESTASIQVALVNMYARCGDAAAMRSRYGNTAAAPRGTPRGEPVYWNALIAAHGLYGHTPRVLRLFSAMQLEGLAPDEVTFTSVLATCGRSRVARWGRGVFQAMISDYGMRPSLAHYRCLIHLFGRGGHLGAAKELIESMEYEPGDVEWTSLLGFCRLHGGLANVKLGREAAIRALEINPGNETAYVLLLNLNAAVHRLEDAKRRWRRRVMENRRRPRYLWRWMREPTWRSLLQGHPHERRMSQRRRHAFIEKLDWRAGVKGRRRQQLLLSNKLPAKTLARMHAFKDYLSPDAWTG